MSLRGRAPAERWQSQDMQPFPNSHPWTALSTGEVVYVLLINLFFTSSSQWAWSSRLQCHACFDKVYKALAFMIHFHPVTGCELASFSCSQHVYCRQREQLNVPKWEILQLLRAESNTRFPDTKCLFVALHHGVLRFSFSGGFPCSWVVQTALHSEALTLSVTVCVDEVVCDCNVGVFSLKRNLSDPQIFSLNVYKKNICKIFH